MNKSSIIQFVNFKDPTFVYFLGRYWADGWSKYHCLSCKASDMTHLTPWLKSFGFVIKYKQARKNGKSWGARQAIVQLSNSDFSKKFLIENGFFTKSNDSPTKLLNQIDVHMRHLFWRGFFDGDGCIQIPASKKRTKKELALWGTINQDWCELIALLTELNIKWTHRTYDRRSGKSSCICFYKFDDIIKFCDYIYKSYDVDKIGLVRKWKLYNTLKNNPVRKKTSVVRGVCFSKNNSRWRVDLLKTEIGESKFVGWYKSEAEAIAAKTAALARFKTISTLS